MKRSLFVALMLAAVATQRTASAAATLFFSTTPPPAVFPLGSSLTITNPTVNMSVGQTTTLYLWANFPDAAALPANHDVLNALGFDVRATGAGIVSGHGTPTVANPTHSVGRGGQASRWDSATTGTTNTSGNLFTDIRPFAVTNSGLDPGVDPDFDAGFTNFYVGSISIDAIAPGTTGIKFAVGNLTIGYSAGSADAGTAPPIFFGTGDASVNGATVGAISSLADATIIVSGVAVPEPASLAIMTLAGVALLSRRRRNV